MTRKLPKRTKLVYGVGDGNADYQLNTVVEGKRKTCPYYKRWTGMLNRCYSKNRRTKYKAYEGCSVASEWLVFMNFKQWMEKQDWEGNHLDKDIIEPGNKVYSPDKCAFITPALNNLMTNCKPKNDLPLGAGKSGNKRKPYKTECRIDGKSVFLGSFATAEEASFVYRTYKSNHIKSIAANHLDPRIKQGLLKHAALLLEGSL